MTPLFAFDASLIKVIIFLVVGIIYVMNHLFGGRKEAAQKRQREERRKANELLNDRQSAQTAAQRREIEEFQRSRQKEPQRRASIPPAKPAKPVAKKPPRRLSESPVDAEIVDQPGESVATHVAKHLQNTAFDQRAAHMTDDLSRADQQREQHMRKMFDHNLGKLAKPGAAAEATSEAPQSQPVPVSSTAAALVGILTSPQSVKQAIILNEILQRPTDRW